MTTPLRPCPFCGGEPTMREVPSEHPSVPLRYGVWCRNQGCRMAVFTPDYQDRRDAADAWNERKGATDERAHMLPL